MSEPTDLTASLARLQERAAVRGVTDDDVDTAAVQAEEAWATRIPKRLRAARMDDVDMPMRTDIDAWLDDMTGNLLLLGPVGTGKSHAAVAALSWCHFVQGKHVTFAPVVEVLDALRPGREDDDTARALRSVGVLVLDDLGAEKPSEWTAEQLYGIVNRRWLDEKPTIVTSNAEPEVLRSALDPRLASRLVHDATAIVMRGKDRRRKEPR